MKASGAAVSAAEGGEEVRAAREVGSEAVGPHEGLHRGEELLGRRRYRVLADMAGEPFSRSRRYRVLAEEEEGDGWSLGRDVRGSAV